MVICDLTRRPNNLKVGQFAQISTGPLQLVGKNLREPFGKLRVYSMFSICEYLSKHLAVDSAVNDTDADFAKGGVQNISSVPGAVD